MNIVLRCSNTDTQTQLINYNFIIIAIKKKCHSLLYLCVHLLISETPWILVLTQPQTFKLAFKIIHFYSIDAASG